ncbi:transmembrane protein 14C-like isoform X2 [Amphibalanus amphitrite]|nr:transmembrane protein 14C-like isoform X2 [Amphibalanus amphitrite]XP_043194777.1 transmembrane protein 14C-like isoform X2 [Amphibalanus amphitrite]XP_043194778.1 transmembrane protein 14C-like isoform X2 [Amphibalanus amphitrite]XP_043194779.1 transmembrane protein 14C-like isoform X2 [Amphibalanus amphitrite]
MPADIAAYCYAALVAAGGIIGFSKAGSVPSLVAGLGFGAALAVGAQQVSADPANYHLSLLASSVLLAVMGARFRRSGKMMPAGLVAAISLVFVIRYGSRALTGSQW